MYFHHYNHFLNFEFFHKKLTFLSLTQKLLAAQTHTRLFCKAYEKSFSNWYCVFLYSKYFLIHGRKQKKIQNFQIKSLKHQFVGPTGVYL